MKRYLMNIGLTVLFGHLAGLLVLLLLSFLGAKLENPSAAILPSALVALGMGASTAGLVARQKKEPPATVLIIGLCYGLIPLVVSAFGESSFFNWGTRLLVFFLSVVLVSALALLFPQKKKRRKGRKDLFGTKR